MPSINVVPQSNACCCVGKQNGEPCCPCEMRARGIFKRNGRWMAPRRGETDLGPAYEPEDSMTRSQPAATMRDMAEEIERLRHALSMIAIVDQGCGGTLSPQEQARSAMRQAQDALHKMEPP